MRKTSVLTVLIAILALCSLTGFTACSQPSDPVTYTTIEWETTGDGYYQFKTNDPQYRGYSFFRKTVDNYDGTSAVKGNLRILSGSSNGKGLCVFYQDVSNYYTTIISSSGQYKMYKKTAGVGSTIKDWTTSSAIDTASGALNIIEYRPSATLNTYDVYINDTFVYSFTYDSGATGKIAFLASVSSTENFPSVPVEVKFSLTSPITAP